MKRKVSTAIIVLCMLAGLSLLLYPAVSNHLKSIASGRAISDYRRSVEALEPESSTDLLERAVAYNEALADRKYVLLPFSEEDEREYMSQIRLPGTDVMGYVVIPKIQVSLPIYHGTSDEVLQNGVGHLEGSSLPVGGKGTHAVLSGHRGLISAKLFTDLDQLVIGDIFRVHVLGEVLIYEVDEIQIVPPSESERLQIDPEQDYCTLLTCDPYGVNSHRMLLRGHRIPTPEGTEDDPLLAEVPLENDKLFGMNAMIALPIVIGIGAILISVALVLLCRWLDKRAHRARKDGDGQGSQ